MLFLRKLEYSGELSRHGGKFPDTMECFQTLWKVPGQSTKFLNTLEKFCTLFWKLWNLFGNSRKISGYFGMFPDTLDNIRKILKISIYRKVSRISETLAGHLKNIPDTIERFRTIWKSFWILWKVSSNSVNFSDIL